MRLFWCRPSSEEPPRAGWSLKRNSSWGSQGISQYPKARSEVSKNPRKCFTSPVPGCLCSSAIPASFLGTSSLPEFSRLVTLKCLLLFILLPLRHLPLESPHVPNWTHHIPSKLILYSIHFFKNWTHTMSWDKKDKLTILLCFLLCS